MIEAFSFGLNWSILFAVVVAFMGSVLMAARRLRVRHHKVTLRALEREALKIWRADRPWARGWPRPRYRARDRGRGVRLTWRAGATGERARRRPRRPARRCG
jgi:hypothetical protein